MSSRPGGLSIPSIFGSHMDLAGAWMCALRGLWVAGVYAGGAVGSIDASRIVLQWFYALRLCLDVVLVVSGCWLVVPRCCFGGA